MRLTQRLGNGSCKTTSRRCCSAERSRVVMDGSFIYRLLPRNRAWCCSVPQPQLYSGGWRGDRCGPIKEQAWPRRTLEPRWVRLQVRQSSALSDLMITKSACARFRTKQNSDGMELMRGTNGLLSRLRAHVTVGVLRCGNQSSLKLVKSYGSPQSLAGFLQ